MRSKTYGQYCGLARALDVVGDRWNLLIVRQLLVEPSRYSDLAAALPGAASNLLADRLRALTAAGVVERRLDPERNGTVYALTPWGAQLRDTIESLIRWSVPLMTSGPGEDSFRPEWLAVALRAFLQGRTAQPPVVIGFETAGTLATVRLDESGAQVVLDDGPTPATVLSAEPGVVLGLAAGVLTVDQALSRGDLRGSAEELARVFEWP